MADSNDGFYIWLILATVLGFAIGWFAKPSRNAPMLPDEGDSPKKQPTLREPSSAAGDSGTAPRRAEKPPETPPIKAAATEPAPARVDPGPETTPSDSAEEKKPSKKRAPRPKKATAPPPKDDLTRIKGIGPVLETKLNQIDIVRFEQIAAWSESDIQTVSAQIKGIRGRVTREGWVESAQALLAETETTSPPKS